MRQYKHIVRLLSLSIVLSFGMTLPAWAAGAADKSKTDAESLQSVAQSYATASPLQRGLIVALSDKGKQVAPAVYKESKSMLGVTVAASATPVTLSSNVAGNTAYVVTSGRYNVLVTNQDGAITPGDPVSVSALSGLGMKADASQDSILGRAVTGFNGKSDVISTAALKTAGGAGRNVAIGAVSVDINIGANPLKSSGQNGVPKFVQNIAVSIVGKPISAPQLYASVAVLLMGIGVVASLLYGGIRTGMTAIGRNPLARQSIVKSMVQVIVTGVIIFAGCLFAVYLILKI